MSGPIYPTTPNGNKCIVFTNASSTPRNRKLAKRKDAEIRYTLQLIDTCMVNHNRLQLKNKKIIPTCLPLSHTYSKFKQSLCLYLPWNLRSKIIILRWLSGWCMSSHSSQYHVLSSCFFTSLFNPFSISLILNLFIMFSFFYTIYDIVSVAPITPTSLIYLSFVLVSVFDACRSEYFCMNSWGIPLDFEPIAMILFFFLTHFMNVNNKLFTISPAFWGI